MRKVLIIIQLLLMLGVANLAKAQYPRLEVSLSVVAESDVNTADAKIQVSVDGEKPPFVYQLFDKAPWEGGKELSVSEKTSEGQYIFQHLKNDNYFVCVTDGENNSRCEYVAIKNE
jgi:hypothetical protein